MSLEFLTSGNWFDIQIDCLVWLQNIRLSLDSVFNEIFLSVTELGELFFATMLTCIVYWCFDFSAGVFLFSVNALSMLFTQLAKAIACIYRPWVLSNRVKPLEAALPRAGGYSFPSGHSSMASSSFGTMAVLFWKKNKLLSMLLILTIILVMFSRLYVGVHTLQDVLAGPIIAGVLIVVVHYLTNWCKKDRKRYIYALMGMNIIALAILYYILTKTYPMDYVDGKLLVNPNKAQYIAVVYVGWILGILNGIYLTARYFPFNPKSGSVTNKIIRGLVGAIILYIMLHYIQIYFFEGMQNYKLTFASMFLGGFFITFIYPLIFSKFSSK